MRIEEMAKHRISFHPLFRMHLVQMLRYGETKQAIRMAGREIQLARERARSEASDEGDQDGTSGTIIVPTPHRLYELGYTTASPNSTQMKGPKP